MAQSTFNDPQLWLNNLVGNNEQGPVITEADKRKWSTLGEDVQPFVKHFNNEGDNDMLTQLGKQGNDALDLNLSPSELRQKRKEQNRIAQQNFRQRKNMYLKELEDKVNELEERRINETKHLQEENQALRLKVKQMETEIYTLKGAEQAFNLSIQKLREAGIQLPVGTTSVVPSSTTSDPMMTTSLSPSDQHTATTPSPSILTATPNHNNNNTWHTPPYLSSSPYSASSNSMTGTSSPPLDQSTDHPVYDDNDHNVLTSSSMKKVDRSEHSASSRLSPSNNDTMDHATTGTILSEQEDIGFAASETDRFDHQPDPLVQNGAKTIPYTQIWERVQEHPKYELFDMDLLCEDLKKKARCSGSGAVILEEDFIKLLEKYDA